jgi:hypothetical protein
MNLAVTAEQNSRCVPVITPNLKRGGSHFRGLSEISLPLIRLAANTTLLCSAEPLRALCAKVNDEKERDLVVSTGSAQQDLAPNKRGSLNHHVLSLISCRLA